jgi:ABC-type proline/glycine betaine transport system ATPase subunit
MIELLNFTKRYGRLPAVDTLNLKIEPGEVFGFIERGKLMSNDEIQMTNIEGDQICPLFVI